MSPPKSLLGFGAFVPQAAQGWAVHNLALQVPKPGLQPWPRSYFVFWFHFLLEGFPYCGESVHGCNGGSHLWSWKRQVPQHKPGHSLSLEETQFRPWAEGHPYNTTDNLLKTSCSMLFGHGIGLKLLNLGPALPWVPHIVFPPGKNNRCSLFYKMCTRVTQKKNTIPISVNLGFWCLH